MRRFSLVPKIGDGLAIGTAFRPSLPAGVNWVSICEVGNRYLVQQVVPDGTAVDTDTIADTNLNGDLIAAALTPAQRTTVKNRLQTLGYDVSQFDADNITDRAKLMSFILRRLANRSDIEGILKTGYRVSE